MAKKRRPLRRSYAGVAPSVSAPFTDAERIAILEKELSNDQALASRQHTTIMENAKVVVELNQKLADLQRQLAAKDKELGADERRFAAHGADVDFLWEEIDRYRNRLIQHLEWDAMLPEDLREAVRTVRVQAYADEHDDDEADDE
ncbi:MAG: hypothetical protein AABM40_04485 [Chloroflexota bacterium]